MRALCLASSHIDISIEHFASKDPSSEELDNDLGRPDELTPDKVRFMLDESLVDFVLGLDHTLPDPSFIRLVHILFHQT